MSGKASSGSACGQYQERPTKKPSVSGTHFVLTRGEPQEKQTTCGPLKKNCRCVEFDHGDDSLIG
jgi:hypothetical protein